MTHGTTTLTRAGTTGPSAILGDQTRPSPAACWRLPPPPPRTSRVSYAFPLSHMPPPITRHGCQVHASLTSLTVAAFPASTGRSARSSPFSRLARHSLALWPACSPSHLVTLYTKGFSHFVTSMTAPIASGRSERGRAGFAPAGKAPTLHGARRTQEDSNRVAGYHSGIPSPKVEYRLLCHSWGKFSC